jgi:hypothetical protein
MAGLLNYFFGETVEKVKEEVGNAQKKAMIRSKLMEVRQMKKQRDMQMAMKIVRTGACHTFAWESR